MSVAPGTPDGIYDVIVADGIRTGIFGMVALPAGVKLRYVETTDEEDNVTSLVRLYVGVEPPSAHSSR